MLLKQRFKLSMIRFSKYYIYIYIYILLFELLIINFLCPILCNYIIMPENLGWNLPPLKYLCINSVLVHNHRIQQHKILKIQLGPIQNKRCLYHGSIISLKLYVFSVLRMKINLMVCDFQQPAISALYTTYIALSIRASMVESSE